VDISTSLRETDAKESTDATMSSAPRHTPIRSSLCAEFSNKTPNHYVHIMSCHVI